MKKLTTLFFVIIIFSTNGRAQILPQILSEIETLPQVSDYLSDYLTKKKLRENAYNFGIGGFIDVEYLKSWTPSADPTKKDVLNIYPCFEPATDKTPAKFYVGYVQSTVPDTTSCGCYDNKDLKRSSAEFTYRFSNYAPDDIGYFLSLIQPVPTGPLPSDVPKGDVKTLTDNFFAAYSDDAGHPYNSSRCTYLLKSEIDALITQYESAIPGFQIKYVKYFLGFSTSIAKNRVRIILIGADQNGKNYTLTSLGLKTIMWEKAWPPDPCIPLLAR